VNGTTKLNEFLKSADFADYQKFIAFVDENHSHHLLDLAKAGGKYLILIGPEGDFDPKEIQLAFAHGFQAVSLGKSRLRTETAGLAAIQMLQVINR
jgi:16S rRNA (uracil1498-N3)-methyltransferase